MKTTTYHNRQKEIGLYREYTFIVFSVLVLLITTGCGRPSPSTENLQEGNEITVPVIVEEIIKRDLAEYINITGKLKGISEVTFYSETSGRVLNIYKTLGDWIEKNENFGVLDNQVFRIRYDQAVASLASVQAALEKASLNHDTANKLFDRESISRVEYQQSLFAYQAAVAQRDGAKANLESAQRSYENSRLVAPATGYISSINISEGETLSPNTPIATIVNDSQLILATGISERHIRNVDKDQNVIIDYRGKEYSGVIRGVGVKPLPNSSSYPVEIVLDNKERELMSGNIVNARIQSNLFEDVIFIESANIRTQLDKSYVYIVDDNSLAIKVIISKGKQVDNYTIVTDGISTGDLLITEGIDSVQDGTPVNLID